MATISTALTRLLGIQHPILLAPMGSAAGGKLAATVTHAGGLGLVGSGYADEKAVRRELSEAGNARVGVGFILWALDKNPKALELLKELVAKSDIVLDNFRPDVMPRLGLGYEDLAKINPRLIYCSMTGFGQKGPKGGQTAYDNVVQAISGLMTTTGWPDTKPVKVGPPVLDYGSGTMAAFAISVAYCLPPRSAGASSPPPRPGPQPRSHQVHPQRRRSSRSHPPGPRASRSATGGPRPRPRRCGPTGRRRAGASPGPGGRRWSRCPGSRVARR